MGKINPVDKKRKGKEKSGAGHGIFAGITTGAVAIAIVMITVSWMSVPREGSFVPLPMTKTPPTGISPTSSKPSATTTTVPATGLVTYNGRLDAPVTIMEYSDFQCSHCQQFALTVEKELETAYIETGKVRLIYKFLNGFGEESRRANLAAACAAEQGQFWPYYFLLMQQRASPKINDLSVEKLQDLARQLGLDMDKFSSSLQTDKFADLVDRDDADGRALGVTGTPTFFINGQKKDGANNLQDLSNIIDPLLGKQPTSSSPTAGSLPDQAILDARPFRGPEKAIVNIIEFSDFQCPYSRAYAVNTLPQILATYGNKVHYYFLDYPLSSIHANAEKAAEASLCAFEQGKFWEYHDLIFQNQSALDLASLKKYAGSLGLQQTTFDQCLDTNKFAVQIQQDLSIAKGLGVTGTPTLFINDRKVVGAQPFSVFQQIIEGELGK